MFQFALPILIVAFGIAIKAVMSSAAPDVPKQEQKEERPLNLYVEKAFREDVKLIIYADGEVAPEHKVTLIAEVSGRIIKTHRNFVEGGIIPSGQPIVEIDPADYLLGIAEAKANIATAEVEVTQSEAQSRVARKQLGGSAQSPLALRLPQVAEAKAKLEVAKTQLQQANLSYARTRSKLPFEGLINNKEVDIGQYVTVGTVISEVNSIGSAELRLGLTDNQLASLGQTLGFKAELADAPKVTISAVVANQTFHWDGYLDRLDAAIDSETRLVYGYVKIVNPYGKEIRERSGMPLPMGLYVDAEVEGLSVDQALLIPQHALRSGNKVFLINNGKLEIRQVEVGPKYKEQVILTSGVEEGELVVVSPVRAPVDGMNAAAIFKNQQTQAPDAP